MKEAERAEVLAVLQENSNIINADGEEFFKNLSENEKFKYLISDMVKGKAIIEEDGDGGIKIDLPMEQTADVKIEKATEAELEAIAAKKAEQEAKAAEAEVGESTQAPIEEAQIAEEAYVAEAPVEQAAPAYAEPVQEAAAPAAESSDLDAAIEAEMAKMKNEGLIHDNSEIVIDKESADEDGFDYSASYERPSADEVVEESSLNETAEAPSYTEPEAAAETSTQVEVVQEPEPAPEGESDLDRQIREEMEKMKSEGLVHDNSKIVIDKYDEDSMNY